MEWDKEAIKRHEQMPIPPSSSLFAKKWAEKIARKKNLNRVTVNEVKEAEASYENLYGREKTQEMRNLLEGREPVPKIIDELFFDPSGMLYNIGVCPVKYGSRRKEAGVIY